MVSVEEFILATPLREVLEVRTFETSPDSMADLSYAAVCLDCLWFEPPAWTGKAL